MRKALAILGLWAAFYCNALAAHNDIPPAVEEKNYAGCGPLLETGRVFYVAVDGDDLADGRTRATAWRTIPRACAALEAGDTLLIDEGEYLVPHMEIAFAGAPGRPVCIAALPRRLVIFTGAQHLTKFQRAEKWRYLWHTSPPASHPKIAIAWEALHAAELRRVPSLAEADELPGTFWHDASANQIYAHFSDSRDATLNGGIYVIPGEQTADAPSPDSGLHFSGGYALVKGIWFKHYQEALTVGGALPAQHFTVENCIFSACKKTGLRFAKNATDCLANNNAFFSATANDAENCFADNAEYYTASNRPAPDFDQCPILRPLFHSKAHVFYISTNGCDENNGASLTSPFLTWERALAALQPGDVLRALPGIYPEPLQVHVGGRAGCPIYIKAEGSATLSGIEISAPYVEIAGFTVRGGTALIRTPHTALRKCLIYGAPDAGVRLINAPFATLFRLTVVDCERGIVIESGSTATELRQSLIAGNRSAQIVIAEDAWTEFIAGQNCYFGPGLPRRRIEKELGSIIAAPRMEDYHLRWDSPTTFLAPDRRPPGALPFIPRTPEIANVRAAHLWANAALLHWDTPFDDTTCRLEFRPLGTMTWQSRTAPTRGTVHGAGICGLTPAISYELRIIAESRSGVTATSEIFVFTTPPAGEATEKRVYYVSPEGDDAAYGQAPEKAWRSLRKACFEAGPGDTVLIAPGDYAGPLVPLLGGETAESPTVFKRHGNSSVVIDGAFCKAPLLQITDCANLLIEGITFARPDPQSGAPVIQITGCRNIELRACQISETPPLANRGIEIQDSEKVKIDCISAGD